MRTVLGSSLGIRFSKRILHFREEPSFVLFTTISPCMVIRNSLIIALQRVGLFIASFANHLLKFVGEQVFETNSVYKEGVQYQVIYDSIWAMSENQQFINNKAVYGGAMALQGSTSIIFTPPSTTSFTRIKQRHLEVQSILKIQSHPFSVH